MTGPDRIALRLSQLSQPQRTDVLTLLAWVQATGVRIRLRAAEQTATEHPGPASVERAQATIQALEYDFRHFAPASFRDLVAERTERPIHLQSIALTSGLAGAVMRFADHDVIFFGRDRHPIFQQHTIVHELGHLWFNHKTFSINPDDPAAQAQTLVETAAVARFRVPDELLPADYQQQEVEAEAFARFCMAAVKRSQRQHQLRQHNNITLYPPFSSGDPDA